MKVRSLFVGAVALALPFIAIACSDDSTGDFSEAEIVDRLTESGLSQEIAECAAPKVKDADYTEEDLEDPDKSAEITALFTECMRIDVDIPEGIEMPEDIDIPELPEDIDIPELPEDIELPEGIEMPNVGE